MKPNKHFDKQQCTTTNTATPPSRLRCSDLKFDERCSDLYLLRNSFSSVSLKNNNFAQINDLRHSNTHTLKKKQMETLKDTLNKLQDKVNAVKQQLQIPSTLMKKKSKTLIHYEQVTQQKQQQNQKQQIPIDSCVTLKKSDKKLAALITNLPKPANFKPIYTNPYSPRRHATYYVSEAVRAINQKNSLVVQHINASIKIIKQCQPYQIPATAEVIEKRVNFKKSQHNKKKKTLVLDLDQTLIHCVDNYESEADLRLSIKLQGDERVHQFGINIRPYALTFLKKMSKKFEIVIFTASQQEYADAILNELDPENQLFQLRLYRQHCWVLENEMHVKDMRIINRNLSEIVLVDNAAYSYAFQLQNGIPILPYYEGSDYQLAALENYLDQIDRASDVRELNKNTFKFHHYTKFCSGQQLIEELYANKSR